MSDNEALMVAVLRNDLETALYETGHLLKKGATLVLENTWIHCLALVAENLTEKHTLEFIRCIETLKLIMDDSDINVKDAFLLTCRLAFLSSKYATLYARPPLAKIKDKILVLFPEGASLSSKGAETFQTILPSQDSHEYDFMQRILAGLTKLWSESDISGSRIALEYLSRKRMNLPRPKWITGAGMDDCDIIWTLWGAVLLFFPKNMIIQSLYQLFVFSYKKQHKNDRLGLLWCILFVAKGSDSKITDDFTANESRVYNHIANNISNLWKQVCDQDGDDKPVEYKDSQEPWVTFWPRGQSRKHAHTIPDFCEELRVLKIKNRNKDKLKDKEDNYEAGSVDPRYRGIYSYQQKPSNKKDTEQRYFA
jgi:hypothetical protein